VGHLLVQVAKLKGATVVATGSSAEKRQLASSLGADAVVDSTADDLADTVLDAAGGPVDIVYDGVGRATIDASLSVVGTRGAVVDRRFPLDWAADAHARLESRESRGKLLLEPRTREAEREGTSA